ncbi:hypothetical protein QAD02_000754 [Eretmocerus hayati]|uniref:Uncharacterized protein n=1 Tax=Eretmocerus hayati TaxID=131215 RepID=A0ACC2NIW9_9HYME|nr:hypothetical protein QAD02_000754 [Eretmocerus hayati]
MSKPRPSEVVHNKKNQHFWEGKRVTKKKYEANLQNVERAKSSLNEHGKFQKHNLKAVSKSSEVQTCQNSPSSGADDGSEKVVCQEQDSDCSMCDLEGRRIIHLKTLGKNLSCVKCESILPLVDTTSEKRIGLASVLHVKCRKCPHITAVGTDKMHRTSQQIVHYDVNFKTVMGILNAGMGNTHINKVLPALNIPKFEYTSMRTYEKKLGKITEVVARESCDAAALEERRLTIENADKLKVLL